MDMIAHQTITEQLERLSLFQVADRLEESRIVALAEEHGLPVVATIDHVVDQAGGNGT